MKHWAEQYVGKPYHIAGFGPDAFNCWGLFWWVSAKHYGRNVPKYEQVSPLDLPRYIREMQAAIREGSWERITQPEDGCAVAMSSRTEIHHVGIFLDVDGGKVLHSVRGKGVLCQSIPALGILWNKIEFYRQCFRPPA